MKIRPAPAARFAAPRLRPPSTSRTFAVALFAVLLALLSLPSAPAAEDPLSVNPTNTPSIIPPAPHDPVPPAPAGLILDQAQVLRPEAAARLTARLDAARAADVHVYVVTFRTLGVPPSKQEDKLHTLAKDFAKAWTPKKVGAILLFDDEGGLMAVEFSPETDSRFAGFAVEAALKEPLTKIQETGLAREKLEQSAYVVADALVPLQAKWLKDTHRQHIASLIIGTVALLGIGLAIVSALGKPAAASGQPAANNNPPVDF